MKLAQVAVMAQPLHIQADNYFSAAVHSVTPKRWRLSIFLRPHSHLWDQV